MPDREKYYTDIISGFAERTVRRLWIVIIILICLLVATNACWVYYESQFAVEQIEVKQDNENGYNNFIGDNGDIIYGIPDDYYQTENTQNRR